MNAEEYVINRVLELENVNARYKEYLNTSDNKLEKLRKVIMPLLKHSNNYGYYMESVYATHQPVTFDVILGCLGIDGSEIEELDND